MQNTEQAFLKLLKSTFPEVDGLNVLDENPLRLGGDSIIVAGLAASIWRLWSVNVPVAKLLCCSRLAEILDLLPETTREEQPKSVIASESEVFRQNAAQQMIYTELFRDPDSTAYNIPLIATLPQAIEPERFHQALQQAVSQFPVLFCRFYDEEGDYLFNYTGISIVPVERYNSFQQACESFVQPFNPNSSQLLRAAIVPFDGDHTRIMLDFCHIAADGLSVGYFLKQLRAALTQSRTVPEQHTIFDYSRWSQSAEYAEQLDNAKEFWQRQLKPGLAKPRWPLQQEAGQKSLDYAVQQRYLDQDLCGAVRARAETLEVTPFSIFLLAWALLQSDVTGDWNGRLGIVTSGRNDASWQDTFGMFVNTLMLPVALESDTPIREALNALATKVRATMEWQNFPFSAQLDLLNERRSESSPLDAIVAFQNIDYQNVEIAGGQFRAFYEAKKMAQFAMVIHIFDLDKQGYEIQWEHAPSSFSPMLVRSLMERYVEILSSLVTLGLQSPLGECVITNEVAPSEYMSINTVDFNFS